MDSSDEKNIQDPSHHGPNILNREGKDHSSRARRQKWGSSGCGRDSRASSLVETGISGTSPLGRLQKYPKIHVSTGEKSSDSGTDSTQDLMPQHRRERNPERPPSNSHGDWPFLRPPERVPGVPIVSCEHLPQLGKIQEVLPSRRDEAHLR